jgi:hypothetical protein
MGLMEGIHENKRREVREWMLTSGGSKTRSGGSSYLYILQIVLKKFLKKSSHNSYLKYTNYTNGWYNLYKWSVLLDQCCFNFKF